MGASISFMHAFATAIHIDVYPQIALIVSEYLGVDNGQPATHMSRPTMMQLAVSEGLLPFKLHAYHHAGRR